MDDKQIIDQINQLAEEEHTLYARESGGDGNDVDRVRLKQIGVTLDQCWDLLRQRRARRAAGLNPDDAKARDPETVEGYLE